MAKFIKFNIVASDQALTATGVRLLNVDQIESVFDNIAGAVYTVQINLADVSGVGAETARAAVVVPAMIAGSIAGDDSGSNQATYTIPLVAAAATGTLNHRIITLGVSTSTSAAVNPTAITSQRSMPSQSIFSALTANPGGVAATAQLGVDGAATPLQMYWRSYVLSSAVAV
jgi:hypothetical protein|tara:strand:+ start:4352 stop:4867 length:516 start_codon:yes stop_codon:yes gene_type:complete